MQRLAAVLREAYGLVVDDTTLAVAALVWTALVALFARAVGSPPAAAAVVFALGLGAILIENVIRHARRRR